MDVKTQALENLTKVVKAVRSGRGVLFLLGDYDVLHQREICRNAGCTEQEIWAAIEAAYEPCYWP